MVERCRGSGGESEGQRVIKHWDNVEEWAADPLTERWSLLLDMNRDGIFTISDIWSWVSYGFFAPGDGLIFLLLDIFPDGAAFLEYSVTDYGGISSGIISFVAWSIVFIGLAIAVS